MPLPIKRSPAPVPERIGELCKGIQGSQVVRSFTGRRKESLLSEVIAFVSRYIVLSQTELVVLSAWVIASWLIERFDRFPHLGITSPEKRCGKTRCLQVIERIVRNSINTSNITPAALFRLIDKESPTIILDEAQSLARKGTESSEVLSELFCSSIDRNAKVVRCGGANMTEVVEFHIYCPKVIALIGELDGVLQDRTLPVRLERKTTADNVKPYRSREVEPLGEALSKRIEEWAAANADRVAEEYDRLEPFDITNDRLAELLLPLQAILTVIDESAIVILQKYAEEFERREEDRMSDGVLLLMALREIFGDKDFIATKDVLIKLVSHDGEKWRHYYHGRPISDESLAKLLRPYGIRPDRQQKKIQGHVKAERGYFRQAFVEVWGRYLPPHP